MQSLEIISKFSKAPSKPPVLLIHGALFSAKTWQGNLLNYFHQQGFDTHALSLRGHGKSKGSLRSSSLNDYIEDVLSVMDCLDQTPIIIGHSMGGLITQQILARRRLPGAILIASIPPYGAIKSLLRFAKDDTLSLSKMLGVWLYPKMRYWADHPSGIFGTDVQSHQIEASLSHMQAESVRVLADISLRITPRNLNPYQTPIYCAGFSEDRLVYPEDVKRTAELYSAPCKIHSNLGHSFMYEDDWKLVASDLSEWIQTSVLKA